MPKLKLIPYVSGFFLSVIAIGPLRAHHDQPAVSADRLNVPANRIGMSIDEQRGALENRNIFTTSLSGEYAFVPGIFSAFLSLPYVYYDQKDRSDAGRYGKARSGVTFLPMNSQFILGIRGTIGFPTGPNTDVFTRENYWDAGVTGLAGFRAGKFVVFLTGSGLFPDAHSAKKTENAEIPWYLHGNTRTTTQEIELKKVTTWSGSIGFDATDRFSLFLGISYRTPYAGVQYANSDAKTMPSIYRDVSGGISYKLNESFIVSIDYRYPFYRGNKTPAEERLALAYLGQSIPDDKKYKLYDEAWTIAATWRFQTEEKTEEEDEFLTR